MRGADLITHELTGAGLDARVVDGWVYVALPGGRLLWIGAEYGQSLDAMTYASRPAWFDNAPGRPASEASARPSQFEGALSETPKKSGGAVSREGET